jgi:hypothetical protein
MVNVFFTAGERALGRAVRVSGLTEQSPLYQAGVRDGDTLLEVDGRKLSDPQELVNALLEPGQEPAAIPNYRHGVPPAAIHAYRHELQPVFQVPRGHLLPGNNALEQLGIGSWSRGRDWRATGLYGQFVTYAEVLQLIIALALGLWVSLPRKRSWASAMLLVALAGFGFALVLTVTRASWFGCLVSSLIVLVLGMGRRSLIFIGLLAIPLILAGLFVLQQKRNVSFIDQTDQNNLAGNCLARRRHATGEQASSFVYWHRHGFNQEALAGLGNV